MSASEKEQPVFSTNWKNEWSNNLYLILERISGHNIWIIVAMANKLHAWPLSVNLESKLWFLQFSAKDKKKIGPDVS